MKRLIFWEFPRASWQYDVAVAAILAFIFLTPRGVFKDQPRPSNIVQMPAAQGDTVYWLDGSLLSGTPEADRPRKASELLASRFGKRMQVTRVEPLADAEEEVRGFVAVVKP
jgi:hypothetical protein